MGNRLPHRLLLTYNVDEAIETLPFSSDSARERVTKWLMMVAPTAYTTPGVTIERIWLNLPNDVQLLLNNAASEAYPVHIIDKET